MDNLIQQRFQTDKFKTTGGVSFQAVIGVLGRAYYFDSYLAIDGIFGRQTLLAVIAAQKAFKLDADSLVGIQTWRKLLE